jgi:adenylate cyclase
MRVYGFSLRQIADAEARLFRLYVHEPLIMDGVPATQVAEELTELISDLQPRITPLMVYLHRHFLQNAVEQDLFAAMEADLDGAGGSALGQLRVAIAFADIAGYVQFTEQAGEEEALDLVEVFVEAVEESLPGGARVVKNIGDGVMIVGNDASDLTNWAITFQQSFARTRPRIGIHYGETIYRDGDYFGRNVNLASRVVARAEAGEVLITDPVYAAMAPSRKVNFEPIGEVELKGFAEPVALYVARPAISARARRARG